MASTAGSSATLSETRPVDRVVLACTQCRSRHVKCDSVQPICTRCQKGGKECIYQKSRRGGLNKAALERRRLKLQQQEMARDREETPQSEVPITTDEQHGDDHIAVPALDEINPNGGFGPPPGVVCFSADFERLIDLYYENFQPSFPIVLPLHHFNQRRRSREHHGMDLLLTVMQFIGSVYAPWTPPDPYYAAAFEVLSRPNLQKSGFNVQALLIFAVSQHHHGHKKEARKILDKAIAMGLEMSINENIFASQHGEGDPVLQESWRRSYYLLHITDLHFAVVDSCPAFLMMNIPNKVDLPCDDEYYNSGHIPPTTTWKEYEMRDMADVDVVYSSLVYLFDIESVVMWIMQTYINTGGWSEALADTADTKIAIWQSLLPMCKRDPLHPDGSVDEIMFLAHMCSSVIMMNIHRPYSTLAFSPLEHNTSSFMTATIHVPGPSRSRCMHTARALKAADMQTKLLAIPCRAETHHLFTHCITASLAAAQIAACTNLLEDHALSIARDRLRLSIGHLSQAGSFWPLANKMAKEVKWLARESLAPSAMSTTAPSMSNGSAEIDISRDNTIHPINPSASVDIYSGIVLPAEWSPGPFGSSSSYSMTA